MTEFGSGTKAQQLLPLPDVAPAGCVGWGLWLEVGRGMLAAGFWPGATQRNILCNAEKRKARRVGYYATSVFEYPLLVFTSSIRF